MQVEKSFFAGDTETVAQDLLGCRIRKNRMEGKIVETEAYLENDPASHAHPRKTRRNRLMYETYGKVYVYLCYGIHNMLNFTAEKNGVGGVLIRSLEPVEGVEKMKKNRKVEEEKNLCNGPGKICQAMDISKKHNETDMGEKIKILKGSEPEYEVSERIGLENVAPFLWISVKENE
ncbi:MAG: 3-methyladenine DNA glycosylase [Nanohaloarchaea archaeon SW_4_43_9]|nr:MAG: 3-methyladenine DNA glycosylase [Nanohaloarchaea archaeon SW_4_43_9]